MAGKQGALTPTEAMHKTRRSYSQAKYRCGKPGPYASVKFCFSDVDQLIATCGLPTRADQSLDRIDANGHYEAGNLRWASKAAQSVNKKNGKFGSVPPVELYVLEASQTRKGEIQRAATSFAWSRMIDFYNRQVGPRRARDALRDAGIGDVLNLNSFAPEDVRDEILGPGVFTMPSLTEPGHYVILEGGPFAEMSDEDDLRVEARLRNASYDGRILRFGLLPCGSNAPPGAIELLNKCLNDAALNGACFYGRTDPCHPAHGGIEGMMLYAASRLSCQGANATLVPALEAVDLLASTPRWETMLRGPLEADMLFIPDFQVDAGLGWTSTPKDLALLCQLVSERADARIKTFIGVQNPHRLPAGVRRAVFERLLAAEYNSALTPAKPHRDLVRAQARERWAQWVSSPAG